MKKRILCTLLFTAIILLSLDRSVACFYEPSVYSKEVILYATSCSW